MGKKLKKCAVMGAVFVSAVMLVPVIFLLLESFVGGEALEQSFAPVFGGAGGYAAWRIPLDQLTLENYGQVMLDSPEFFVVFWNTVRMTVLTLAGQLLVGLPAAWVLAQYEFRGRKAVYLLYVLLMMMPFQVTMLSNYLLLSRTGLLDTQWGIVLPGVFSACPVFIMYRFFLSVPKEVVDAARLDGAGIFQILRYIAVPLGKPGIAAALFLSFLESWNMLEAPMAFLETKALWPLGLYLPELESNQLGFAFAASVIALVLPFLIFAGRAEDLERGIRTMGGSDHL